MITKYYEYKFKFNGYSDKDIYLYRYETTYHIKICKYFSFKIYIEQVLRT